MRKLYTGYWFKCVFNLFLVCALLSTAKAQVTIASDGFNNTTTLFTISGTGGYISGSSTSTAGPASSPFTTEGTHSRVVTNGSDILTSASINTTSYSSISTSFRLASFSLGSTGNGADAGDIITVEISPDNGTTFYSTLRVLGNSNAYWAYSAGGVATTAYDGNTTPVDRQPAGGGSRTTDGYSTVTVTGLPSVSNLMVRITLLNDNSSERWVLDDFKVTGTLACTLPTAPVATAASTILSNGFTANWNTVAGATNYFLDVYTTVPNTNLATWSFPVSGTTVTPNIASANNTAQTLTTNGGTIIDVAGATTQAPSANAWATGSGSKFWQIIVNATGFSSLKLSSKQKSSNSGPRDFKVQYKIGASGTWTDVSGGVVPNVLNDAFVNGVLNNLTLPAACDNQSAVYLRWIMNSNTSADGTTVAGGGTSRIDDIVVVGTLNNYVPGYQNFSTTNLTEDVAGLSGNTTYYYVVRSNNACGSSANSNQITVLTDAPCAPTAAITSFSPATGPAGTIVTITGSGFTGATAVKFGTIAATSFTVLSSTKIIAEVPANSPTDKISVTVASCDALSVTAFTLINQALACNSTAGFSSDVFISEVYDAFSGSLSYIEIFNGTNATVDLGAGNYVIRMITGTSTITDITLSGTVASGATYLVRVGSSTTSCLGLTVGSDNPTSDGFNGNDRIYLRKNGSNLDYVANPNYGGSSKPGFSQIRKATAVGPSTTYTSSDWVITTTEDCGNLGVPPYSLTGSTITVTTQPQDENDCSAISFTTAATSNPATPNYLWKYFNAATGTWDNASGITGVTITGSNTNNMTITGNTAAIIDYQFYCEISKNTCNLATNAVQFTYGTRPYYRNTSSGNWSNPAIWQMSNSSSDWTAAITTCQYPTKENSSGVFIESPFTVTQDIDINIDYLEVKSGATLTTSVNSQMIVSDSTTGADFIVNGTWNYDANAANSLGFSVSSGTWQLGTAGTIIKTNDGSSSVLRDSYEGTMSTIPSTANWIIRYTGAGDVSFTTVGGTYYPNLTFESNSGLWAPSAAVPASRFTGNSGYATVKGNLDIGGTGTGTVIITNENTNAQPMLITGNAVVRTGNTITTAGAANGTGYEVKGNVTVNGTLTAISNNVGLLKLSGSGVQNVSGTGTINLQDFTAANTASTITLNKDITIPGVLTSSSGTLQLTTGNITMKSTALATSRVAPVVGAITYGTGQFIIERNVAALRSWRLLTAPVVSSQTIRQAWMENAVPSTTSPLFNDIPVPNYGTHISGPLPSVNGFDVTPLNNYSIKKYDAATSKWIGTGITPGGTSITSEQGWMLFVRGDRSYPISTTTSGTTPQPTTLRTKGQIKTGPQPLITPVGYTVVGNPYASAVSFRNVTKTVTGTETYYIWDPKLTSGTTSTTVGGFITCTWNGTKYIQAPVALSAIDDLTGRIESGAAIVVSSANITSLSFKEADKATGSNLVFRPTAPVTPGKSLRANLYVKNADASLALFDGTMHLFDKSFSNKVDGYDALKLTNFADNLSIKNDDTLVAIECRKMPTYRDTIFYNLKQLKVRNYTLEFVADNMYDYKLRGFIEDKYLQRKTRLNMNGTTQYSFSVEDVPGAYAANRFHIAFRKVNTLFGLNALGKNDDVTLTWHVTEENDISKYEVERSANGVGFQTISTALSKGDNDATNRYLVVDNELNPGFYYYRLKIITNNGAFAYSDVVKVTLMNTKLPMYVFPNPVTNGNIGLQFNNQPAGKYAVRLMNELGQVVLSKQLVHAGGTASHNIAYTAAAGNYQLEVTAPGKKQTLLKVQLVQ